MPKIPTQKARTVMPNVGGGGGGGSRAGGGGGGGAAMGSPNASRYANIEGTGLQSAGQSIASGAAGLSQAFQHAGQVRDQINAHLDSLNAKTGAFQLSMEGAARMKQNKEYVQEQLRTQQDKDPRTWTVQVRQPDGSFTEMSPDPAMQSMLRETMDEYLGYANVYGPEAVAQVAGSLSRDGQTEYSNYSDTHIKMKHDKSLGDWQSVAERLEHTASDPTNTYAETAKDQLDDHIRNGVTSGIISTTEGVKLKETMMAGITDKRITLEAIRQPFTMLERIAGIRKDMDDDIERIGTAVSGRISAQRVGLPKDIDISKLPHYQELALGEVSRRQAKEDRAVKAYEAGIKAEQEKTFGTGLSILLAGGSVMGDLPEQISTGKIDPDKANTLRMVEFTLREQKAHDPVLIRNSALERISMSRETTKAMYGAGGSLDEIEQRVENNVINNTLLPRDAEPLLTEIRTAKAHLVSEETRKENEEVRTAHSNLVHQLTTKGPLEALDPISEDVKAQADADFWWMKRNTKKTAWEIQAELLKRYEPIIAERKNIMGESPELAKLTDEKLNSAVMRGQMTRAGAQAVREKTQNEKGRKITSDLIKAYKPPPPTTWERVQKFGESVSEFGQRLFEDPGTEANP